MSALLERYRGAIREDIKKVFAIPSALLKREQCKLPGCTRGVNFTTRKGLCDWHWSRAMPEHRCRTEDCPRPVSDFSLHCDQCVVAQRAWPNKEVKLCGDVGCADVAWAGSKGGFWCKRHDPDHKEDALPYATGGPVKSIPGGIIGIDWCNPPTEALKRERAREGLNLEFTPRPWHPADAEKRIHELLGKEWAILLVKSNPEVNFRGQYVTVKAVRCIKPNESFDLHPHLDMIETDRIAHRRTVLVRLLPQGMNT